MSKTSRLYHLLGIFFMISFFILSFITPEMKHMTLEKVFTILFGLIAFLLLAWVGMASDLYKIMKDE